MDATVISLISHLGLLSTAFLAGRIATFTTVLTPILTQSPPPLLTRQWRMAWDSSQSAGPPTMLGASLLYVWLASLQDSWWNLYLVSAACVVGMVPYTLTFMTGFEVELLRREEAFRKEAAQGKVDPRGKREATVVRTEKGMHETRVKGLTEVQLVEAWGRLNLGRAGFMLAATVVAVLADFV